MSSTLSVAPARAGARRRAHVRLSPALLAGVYLALSVLLTSSTWLAAPPRYIGTASDPILASWSIGWAAHALAHGWNPLHTTYANAPLGFSTLWNVTEALPLLLLWPITALFGPLTTYNLAMTLGVAGACFSAFLAIRRHVRTEISAALGGAVYGFSPFVMGQLLGHPDLVLSAALLPLAWLLLEELVVRQRLREWRLGIMLAGFAVLQFFVWQESLFTDVLAGAIVCAVLLLLQRDGSCRRIGYALRCLGLAAPVAALLLAAPVVYQFFGPGHVSSALHPQNVYVTDLANLVVPTPLQLLAPAGATELASHFSGNVEEWAGYIGIPMLLLLVVACALMWRSLLVRTASLSGALLLLLSLGPQLHVAGRDTGIPLPWALLQHLPFGADALPSRLMVYAFFAVALLFALSVDRLWARRRSLGVCAAVSACALLPLLPMAPTLSQPASVPAYFTSSALQRDIPQGTTVLVLPWPDQYDAAPMLWQMQSGYRFRLVGGYFNGPAAPGSAALRGALDAAARGDRTADAAQLLQLLRRLGVRAVIVTGVELPRLRGSLSELLGAPIHSEAQLAVWRVPAG